ncbi:MAG: TonB-dependent receptor plug domain-containing protein [Sphingomonadales bacterium]|nr:TonB-dependent receptor plug domain-containing protein [Sphingomonadales bacterium]
MQRRLGIWAVALAALPGVARAEDGPEIVVTGHGLGDTPATPAYDVQTISKDALQAAPSGRIEDALANVAGFQQFRRADSRSSNPSAQGATLRALGGNAASRALVLLDGVPLADPFFGYLPFSALAPERLGSVRVTRGGGSGAFGAGAVAGTIELNSANAAEAGLFAGSALADDRGESEVSGTLTPRLGAGFTQVSGRWDRGQGFWTTPESQRVTASVKARYDSWSTGLRGVAPLGDGVELQVHGMAFSDHRVLRFDGALNGSQGQDAGLRLVGRGAWTFDALAYLQARGFSSVTVSASTFRPTLNQYRTPSTGWGGKFELRPPVGDAHVLRLGFDGRVGSGRTQEVLYNAATGAVTARRQAGGRNSDFGAYAEDDWTLGALTLTGGLRADRWSVADGFFTLANPAGVVTTDNAFARRADWAATWRGGALLKPGAGVTLRAAGYANFRQPTLNELYRPFTVTASSGGKSVSTATVANDQLRNERLKGFEGGIDWAPAPGVMLSLTGFSDRLEDAIANVTTGTVTTATTVAITRQRMNVDAIRARGLEATAHLGQGPVSLDGSLAWTDAKVQASGVAAGLNGLRPAQVPKLAASVTAAWKPRPGWNLALTLRHTGAQYEDDLQTDTLPAATTLGAYAELPLAGPFALVLRGENLTGTDVITRNQAGSIDLGAPRTVWAGVKARIR